VSEVACCILITLRTAWTNRPREDGVVEVPVIPDDFSEERLKETVGSSMDLGSGVIGKETGGAEKVISGPCPEPCGIATTVPGDGALEREFSEGDNDPAERR
jgi:hypothetical protein